MSHPLPRVSRARLRSKLWTRALLLVSLAWLAIAGRAAAQEPAAVDLQEFARRWLEQTDFSGSLELQRGSQVLASVTRGETETGGAPIRADTAFWIGSLSKQFAAVAVLRLAEQGRLALEAPVAGYFPELGAEALTKSSVPCSVEHLLAHTCGLPRELDLDPLHAAGMLSDPSREERLLSKLRSGSLSFVPGTEFQYSNVGYALVGLLVQRAAGVPYEQFLQQTFFGPLGMQHTGIQPRAGITLARGQLGLGFAWVDAATWTLLDSETPAQLGAAGNIYSTPGDLLRWSYALHHGQLLSEATYQSLIRPRLEDYGLGVAVKQKPFGKTVYHLGALSPHAASAFLVYAPEHDLAFAAVSNRGVEVSGLADLAVAVLSEATRTPSDLAPRRAGGLRLLAAALTFLVLLCLVPTLLVSIWSCCRRRSKFDRIGWWSNYHGVSLALLLVLFRWRDRPLDPLLLAACAALMLLGCSQRWWSLPPWTKARGYRGLFFNLATLVGIAWICPWRVTWVFAFVTVVPGLVVAALAVRRGSRSAALHPAAAQPAAQSGQS